MEWLNIKMSKGRSKALVEGRMHFWDDSLLGFHEELIESGIVAVVIEYAYHYQSADGELLFRYDNSPHYPDIITFPHHKHVGAGINEIVEPAQPPSLIQVLREIERMLSTSSE